MLALTHLPSPRLAQGQRTFVARSDIDYHRAVLQHQSYCEMLRDCGAEMRVLNVNPDLPDSLFVEDTAIVLDEVAVLASMGVESRRAESDGIELEIRKYREIHRIALPATIEGGDVLRVGRTLLVGLSSRTNRAGLAAFEAIVRGYGYDVMPVPVRGCLHFKTACTALPDGTLLVNPAWLDEQALRGLHMVAVPEDEPWAANVLLAGSSVCVAAGHPRTADMIRARGFEVRTVDLSEFAKAEGGVTCLSILVSHREP
jgi:dimethylargininase